MDADRNPYQSPIPAPGHAAAPPTSSLVLGLALIARLMSIILGGLLLILLLSGLWHGVRVAGSVHRWTGHWLVILHWLFTPFALVVLFIYKFQRSPFASIALSLLLLLSLVVSILTSFTGYLGPQQNPDITDETRNRFFVLHMIFLPSILAGLLAAWFFTFRPFRKPQSSR